MSDKNKFIIMPDPKSNTITLPKGAWLRSKGFFTRICGKCSVELSLKNTGELGHLQLVCNECTE
jgi:hypothetical protein